MDFSLAMSTVISREAGLPTSLFVRCESEFYFATGYRGE
jgi:hypothetical protein